MEVFTLYVGTRQSGAKETLLRILREQFESFTVIQGEGHFRGAAEPMWFVKIATTEPQTALAAAEEIRSTLNQEGVGIEHDGCYYRCTQSDPASALRKLFNL